MCISRSGFAKRAVRVAAWADTGERALRFVGRRERRSKEVGIDSGIGSDMLWELSVGSDLFGCGEDKVWGVVAVIV